MRQTPSGLVLFLLCLPAGAAAAGPEASWPSIDGGAVLEHVKVLSSDAFEGRAPGSHGEELTVGYLAEQLQKMGIQPGNPDGTYIQQVPLVGTKVKGHPTLIFQKGSVRQELAWRDDFVAWTKRVVDQVRLEDSELVFAGCGVQAPEFSRDDFKGLDVKGKAIVVLVGDPPVPEKGYYYRSDHFPFARKGVPAINAGTGVDYVGRPADYGKKIRDDYIAHDYHKPSDQVRPDWDMSGAAEDLELFFRVGYEVAQGETFPAWKPGAEFEAQRQQMLSAGSGQ
jgi:hypothetical protein